MDLGVFFKAIGGILSAALIVGGLSKIASIFPDNWFLIVFVGWAIVIMIAFFGAREFKVTNGESGLVVYSDYYDIFKCLSVAGVPYIIFQVGMSLGQDKAAAVCAALYAVGMVLHICYESAKVNKFSQLPIIYITKFSMSFIWIIALIQVLDPSGKNASERRRSRGIAVLTLLFITPLINMFVLDDDGKELIRNKFKGRRFSGAREMRNSLNQ